MAALPPNPVASADPAVTENVDSVAGNADQESESWADEFEALGFAPPAPDRPTDRFSRLPDETGDGWPHVSDDADLVPLVLPEPTFPDESNATHDSAPSDAEGGADSDAPVEVDAPAEAEPTVEVGPTVEVDAERDTDLEIEPESEPEIEPEAEPELSLEAEPEADLKSDPELHLEPEAGSESEPDPEPEAGPGLEVDPDSERAPDTDVVPAAGTAPTTTPEPEFEPVADTAEPSFGAVVEAEPVFAEPVFAEPVAPAPAPAPEVFPGAAFSQQYVPQEQPQLYPQPQLQGQTWAEPVVNAGPASAPASAPSRSRKPLVAVGAALAVLLAFGGGYAVRVLTEPSATAGLGATHAPDAAPAVVQSYLQALADGQGDIARAMAGAGESEALLTDDVMAQSRELAPISDISVGEAVQDGDTVQVSARFKIGEMDTERSFHLQHTAGGWQLYDALVPVTFPALAGFGVQLNGVSSDGTATRVFPGSYQISLPNQAFELGSEADVLTIATTDQALALRDLQPRLTAAATGEYVEMVRSSLDDCLASKELVTPCGLDVSARLKDGANPVEGTVQRSLTDDDQEVLAAPLVQLDPESAGTVFSVLNLQLRTRLEAENNGARVSGELLYAGQLLNPHVDFTADAPVVVWK